MGRRWVRQAAAMARSLGKETARQTTETARALREALGQAQRHGTGRRARLPHTTLRRLVQATLLGPLCVVCWAQSAPPAPVPVPDTPGLEVSDRVKRDAERPMYWIRRLGEQTASQGKASQERNAAEKAAAERAARTARSDKPDKPSPAPRPAPAASEPAPTPVLATRDSTGEAGPSAAPASPSPAPAPAVASGAPSASAPELPVASASSPAGESGESGAPATERTGGTDVAMATPPHHAESAAPPPPPEVDTLVLRPGETLALPDSLMRRMRRGSVEVKVQVAPDGSVMDATIVQSSHPRLDSAALEAIKAAHFQPVSRPTTAVIQFGFDLDS